MLLSVQYLRGFAALSVVAYHLHLQLGRLGYEGWWPSFLAAGVDLFFAISGFVMWKSAGTKELVPIEFYRRRFIRIVPLYWMFTTVVVLIALVLPSLLQSTKFDLMHVIASYLFIPYVSPGDGTFTPILNPGWTLNFEMFFYLLFGLALFLPQRLRLAAISVALLGLVILGLVLRPTNAALSFWTSSLLIEFLFGIGIAIVSDRARLPRVAAAGIVILGVMLLFWRIPVALDGTIISPNRFIAYGAPAALILLGAVLWEKQLGVSRIAPLQLIGDASYSIYLSHGLVLSAVTQVLRRMPIEGVLQWTLLCVGGFVSSVVVGVVAYYVFERPVIERFSGKHLVAPSAQPAHP